MARCLVLGANGFIGSHLTDSLVAAGHTVRCFDRYRDKTARYDKSDATEMFAGDFLNEDSLRKAVKDIDYVFHFISTTTPVTADNDPLIDIETNIRMSVRLFQLCVDAGVKKVIFASTGGAIYGSRTHEPISERSLPRPVSPYAIGKLTIEHYLRYFEYKHGMKSLVYRISNPYGERQPLNSKQGVIPIFLERIARNEPITVYGDGKMIRDFLYVKDTAAMITGSFETASKQIYNLGSGVGISVNEIVGAIERTLDHKVEVRYEPVPPTFVEKVVLDVDMFEEEFGLKATTELGEGIQRTWKYIQAHIN